MAHATWHHSSSLSRKQQQLLSALRAACWSSLSSNTLHLILAPQLLSDFCASTKPPKFNSHHLIFTPEFDSWLGIALPQTSAPHQRCQHLLRGALPTRQQDNKLKTLIITKMEFLVQIALSNISAPHQMCQHHNQGALDLQVAR